MKDSKNIDATTYGVVITPYTMRCPMRVSDDKVIDSRQSRDASSNPPPREVLM